MGMIREVLFGKVDLDTMMTALVMGVSPEQVLFRHVSGSASGTDLADRSVLCIEVGGSGRSTENNFDHHSAPSMAEKTVNLSACAQALRRMARLVEYIDELDRGVVRAESAPWFPSLSQLVSGMLLVVKDPEQRMRKGLEILQAVLQSGIDPCGCMEPILDHVPHARWYTEQKRAHDLKFEEVTATAHWYITKAGYKLAIVETTWIGAPGALYGRGAEVVIAFNPAMELRGGETIRKFTVAGNNVSVLSALQTLSELEEGWGGPAHGTIGGSPQGKSSCLSLEEVTAVVIATL